jgi:hypothetical protein
LNIHILVYREGGQWWKESSVELGIRERNGEGEEGFEEVINQLEEVLNI